MKRNLKRAALLTLSAAALSAAMALPAGAAITPVRTYNNQFTDVSSNDWYAASVKDCYELGLINGSSATTFNPQGTFTLGQAVTVAARMHNLNNGGSGTIPSAAGAWYQGAVNYCIQNGIVASGEFTDYNANATRAQVAKILASTLPDSSWTAINHVTELPDVIKGSTPYAEEIFLLYNAGVFTGSDQYGTFNPQASITRAEVAAMIQRCADPSDRKVKTLTPLSELPPIKLASDLDYYQYNFSYGLLPFRDESTELWGYMNGVGKVVIPAQYDGCETFASGYVTVWKDPYNRKSTIFDSTGKAVYTNADAFSTWEQRCYTKDDYGADIFETTDVVIINGKLYADTDTVFPNGYFTKNDGQKLYSPAGTLLTTMPSGHYEWFMGLGYAIAQDKNSDMWYFYDLDGKATGQIEADDLSFSELRGSSTNSLIVFQRNKKCGVMTHTGAILSDALYDKYYQSPYMDIVVLKSGSQYTLVGPTGVLLDGQTASAYTSHADYIEVELNDQVLYVTPTEVFTSPTIYAGNYRIDWGSDTISLAEPNSPVIGTDVSQSYGLYIYTDAQTGARTLLDPITGQTVANVIEDSSTTWIQHAGCDKINAHIYGIDVGGTTLFGYAVAGYGIFPANTAAEHAYKTENTQVGRMIGQFYGYWQTTINDKPAVMRYDPETGEKTPVIQYYQGNVQYDTIREIGNGYYACEFDSTWYLLHV